MKKLFYLLLALGIMVSLCACGSKKQSSQMEVSAGVKGYQVDKVFFGTYTAEDGEYFQGSFRVTNTGKTPLFLFNATWELKDQNGKVISPETPLQIAVASPQNINPGETAWFFANRKRDLLTDKPGEIAEAVPSFHTSAEFDRRGTWYLDTLRISDLELTEESGELIATGIVENTSSVPAENALIYVNLYNEDGYLIGKLVWGTLGVAAGDRESFTATESESWPNPPLALSAVANFDAYALQMIN